MILRAIYVTVISKEWLGHCFLLHGYLPEMISTAGVDIAELSETGTNSRIICLQTVTFHKLQIQL
jgi:hypothetical protein